MPSFDWIFNNNTIQLNTYTKPLKAVSWKAEINLDRKSTRDFRRRHFLGYNLN